MADGGSHASALDLGEDLSCAICMQILFQPLTLLDCMHTFCGACLKDWFSHQAASARSIHPYTCPSCRDSVRSTKRYPFIMNMLEKHLAKNPDKTRSEEDQKEHKEKYKPGENVLPKLRLREGTRDPEDERIMNQVVALSLQEAGITENILQEPRSARQRGSSRSARSRTSSRSPRRATAEGSAIRSQLTSRENAHSRHSSEARQVVHQSSLISLISASELDPQEMQDEIMRQITDEGLLDDIDLNNLDPSQEEALSERIARAYQRRREETLRRQREAQSARDRSRQPEREEHRRSNSRPSSRSGATEGASRSTDRRRAVDPRPPVSNPQLISSANQGQVRHRRTGSSSSARASARADGAVSSTPSGLNIEMDGQTQRSDRRRRMSTERSVTDPNRPTTLQTLDPGAAIVRALDPSPMLVGNSGRQRAGSNPQRAPTASSASSFARTMNSSSTSSLPLNTSIVDTARPSPLATNQASVSRQPDSQVAPATPTFYTEPAISCRKCRTPRLEYQVHYKCPKCSGEGDPYALCKNCFRQGEGCRHWFGFGNAALREFEARNAQRSPTDNSSTDRPHIFTAQRYARPKSSPVSSPTTDRPNRVQTEESPAHRLERGVFCDLCSTFANNCYWKCDACNDGEWGYCNNCVNQGKHCTHPLLPLKARDDTPGTPVVPQKDGYLTAPTRSTQEAQPGSPPLTPKSASIIDGPAIVPVANLPFRPLTFHTECDICSIPIPPSVTRYHCPQCNSGDYDICMSCYHQLVSNSEVSTSDGPYGWRKCPQNHRMVVVGFQDAGGGQRRVVDRDLVGGWTFVDDSKSTAPGARKWRWKGEDGNEQALDPEHRTRTVKGGTHVRYPPDGGIGLVFYGRWNYFPAEATERDLCFPKGAEIREAEDINGEWLWGVYAGRTGIFPGAYVHFLRKVTV